MDEDRIKEVARDKLPWFYRQILKVPKFRFLESYGGIFWCIVIPVSLCFYSYLNIFLLVLIPFPINIVLVAIIPTVVLIIFIRVGLDRVLRRLTHGQSGFEWNVEKTMKEYLNLLKKKEEKNKQ